MVFLEQPSEFDSFGGVSMFAPDRDRIALPTVVSKEFTDGGGKELADFAIYVFDLLQRCV